MQQLYIFVAHSDKGGASYHVRALLKNKKRHRLASFGSRRAAEELMQKVHEFLRIENMEEVPVSRTPRLRLALKYLPVLIFCSAVLIAVLLSLIQGDDLSGAVGTSPLEIMKSIGFIAVFAIMFIFSVTKLRIAIFADDKTVNDELKEDSD